MAAKRTVWVLDTETKGTGAEMVPLEKLEERKRLRSAGERLRVIRRRPGNAGDAAAEPAPPQRDPRRFRVMNILTRRLVADDVDARDALEALRSVDSIVDVQVDSWDASLEDWRPLAPDEKRVLWSFRDADTD